MYLQLEADGVVDEKDEQEASFLQFTNLLNRIKGGNPTAFKEQVVKKSDRQVIKLQRIIDPFSLVPQ
ncbi:hypothetical protein JZO78_06435 [Enterococcus ureilyticus]|uniref:hypothetical protein n=1 Tax=Enterococcus ureilyticus TaxID=1131292 RepID=UPI001A922DF0|nr:hypothetical protein [Enterococcus ureilyticus]MBO0445975.1 hypothetical protein [Enterococcus ureilyticus]